eukprot:gnl/TRDRNA2_/TRDRNA2_133085_c0_seq1.p1 gnl/TRDRNA2_/TRDRNA2_133085_c0~~gnl/TRDRNA2_/TRDRNA2_133085_c0_seq1.p1  ORF type:complete len:1164 (+),score=231.37 gnl/TRDRNA2_/TRDRNA2_133085_c0_seq1:169-3660(+)
MAPLARPRSRTHSVQDTSLGGDDECNKSVAVAEAAACSVVAEIAEARIQIEARARSMAAELQDRLSKEREVMLRNGQNNGGPSADAAAGTPEDAFKRERREKEALKEQLCEVTVRCATLENRMLELQVRTENAEAAARALQGRAERGEHLRKDAELISDRAQAQARRLEKELETVLASQEHQREVCAVTLEAGAKSLQIRAEEAEAALRQARYIAESAQGDAARIAEEKEDLARELAEEQERGDQLADKLMKVTAKVADISEELQKESNRADDLEEVVAGLRRQMAEQATLQARQVASAAGSKHFNTTRQASVRPSAEEESTQVAANLGSTARSSQSGSATGTRTPALGSTAVAFASDVDAVGSPEDERDALHALLQSSQRQCDELRAEVARLKAKSRSLENTQMSFHPAAHTPSASPFCRSESDLHDTMTRTWQKLTEDMQEQLCATEGQLGREQEHREIAEKQRDQAENLLLAEQQCKEEAEGLVHALEQEIRNLEGSIREQPGDGGDDVVTDKDGWPLMTARARKPSENDDGKARSWRSTRSTPGDHRREGNSKSTGKSTDDDSWGEKGNSVSLKTSSKSPASAGSKAGMANLGKIGSSWSGWAGPGRDDEESQSASKGSDREPLEEPEVESEPADDAPMRSGPLQWSMMSRSRASARRIKLDSGGSDTASRTPSCNNTAAEDIITEASISVAPSPIGQGFHRGAHEDQWGHDDLSCVKEPTEEDEDRPCTALAPIRESVRERPRSPPQRFGTPSGLDWPPLPPSERERLRKLAIENVALLEANRKTRMLLDELTGRLQRMRGAAEERGPTKVAFLAEIAETAGLAEVLGRPPKNVFERLYWDALLRLRKIEEVTRRIHEREREEMLKAASGSDLGVCSQALVAQTKAVLAGFDNRDRRPKTTAECGNSGNGLMSLVKGTGVRFDERERTAAIADTPPARCATAAGPCVGIQDSRERSSTAADDGGGAAVRTSSIEPQESFAGNSAAPFAESSTAAPSFSPASSPQRKTGRRAQTCSAARRRAEGSNSDGQPPPPPVVLQPERPVWRGNYHLAHSLSAPAVQEPPVLVSSLQRNKSALCSTWGPWGSRGGDGSSKLASGSSAAGAGYPNGSGAQGATSLPSLGRTGSRMFGGGYLTCQSSKQAGRSGIGRPGGGKTIWSW